jgi:predicted XRE-type DNA-binding protein
MDIIEQVKEMRIEEALEPVVKNLLTETDFSVKKIAEIAGVSDAFVEEVVRLGR